MTTFHLIGIKGSGMSALAQVLHGMGHNVQGSDVSDYYFTETPLRELGIPIMNFDPCNINEHATVIASAAFGESNPEIRQCLKQGIPLHRYHEFLGRFLRDFTSVAVSGTHGKTTTTGLMAHVVKDINPPAYIIGDGTGAGSSQSRLFIFEACEYRRHFLNYTPDYAIITNIDYDHPDYYSSISDVFDAFQSFAGQVKQHVIACGDDENVMRLSLSASHVLYYGFAKHNHLVAKNIVTHQAGTVFDVYFHEEPLCQFETGLVGRHNVLNALAVIGVSLLMGYPITRIQSNMKSFQGTKRRFNETPWGNNVIIDDYAHHPSEIIATIDAVRLKYPKHKLISVFQPHTYTRFRAFLSGFAASLSKSDLVFITDVFASARESDRCTPVDDLIALIPNACYIDENSVSRLTQFANSVLLFMGAGDIHRLIERLLDRSVRIK